MQPGIPYDQAAEMFRQCCAEHDADEGAGAEIDHLDRVHDVESER